MVQKAGLTGATRTLDTLVDLIRSLLGVSGRRTTPAALLVALGALAEGLGLAIIIPLMAVVTTPGHGYGRLCTMAGLCDQRRQLPVVLAGFVAIMTLRAIVLARRDQAMAGLENRYVEHRRIELIRALAGSRWQDVAGLHHARLTYVLAGEVQRLATTVRQIATIAMSMVMLLCQWVLLALLCWPLAAMFMAMAMVATVAAMPAWRRAGHRARADRHSNLAIVNLAGQLLGGLKLALAQNMQDAFVREMEAASQALAQRHHAYERRMGRNRVAGTSAAAVAIAMMVWVGLRGGLSGPALVAAMAIFIRMLGPGGAILRSYQLLASSLPAHAEIAGLVAALGTDTAPCRSSDRSGEPAPGGAIALHGVCYRHDGGSVDFDGIDLDIPAGSRIGITGSSGSGKTTFIDLLSGLLSPQSGSITVDGLDLAGPVLHRWRDSIAYVTQDPYLFNDTIRRNLTWGIIASDDDIARVLAMVEADGIVAALPLGLEQMVGERGIRLSGGERQRLALARALIRRPKVLILDEATNALDLATETRILTRLAGLPSRPTVIIVTHRPQAAGPCDRWLHFDGGVMAL